MRLPSGPTSVHSPGRHWDRYWRDRAAWPRWDFMCQTVYRALGRCLSEPPGTILEAGSGTGRISARLAEGGSAVTLLDYSSHILQQSRAAAAAEAPALRHVAGDIRAIPLASGSFDLVWNAGVLEHFELAEQARALGEMARVCRPGGLVVSLNPSARSWLYRAGKRYLEWRGAWPYGREVPVRSLDALAERVGLTLEAEWGAGFLILICEGICRLSRSPRLRDAVQRAFSQFEQAAPGHFLDRALAAVGGGYLLVSVMRKPERKCPRRRQLVRRRDASQPAASR